MKLRSLLLALALVVNAGSRLSAQNTVFTYQGQVTDNGTNFTGMGQFEFALVTSTNADSTATATANPPSGGYITGYTVTAGGNGYVTAPTVTVSGGGGSGAAATAHLSGGKVTSLSVSDTGDGGYTNRPAVTIAAPPANLAYVTYWSNDGTSVNGSEPAEAVSVAVTNGLFSVVLGDPTQANMMAMAAALFAQPGMQLRIWFNDGVNGFAPLNPAQNLTPVPYAVQAVNATTASNLSGTVSAAQISGAVASVNLSGTYGNALTLPNAGNSFSGAFTGSGASLSGLNANNLASGTVPLARLSGVTSNQLDAATWQLATNSNGGNAALATNVVSGISITNVAISNASISNAIISGDGSGLMNVTAVALATPYGMAPIPTGTFSMGDNLDGETDAAPTNITVSAFYMDINLVSCAQWQSVYFWATNHGYGFVNAGAGKAANHPVQTVDWYDCVKWSNARSQQAGLTPVYYTDAGLTQVYTNGEVAPYLNLAANGCRLPMEAEWEMAARAGLAGQRFPWGNVITKNLANYYGATNSLGYDLGPNGYNSAFTNGTTPYTSPVGYFAPNGYGLFDMADDVAEWCWDWYGTPYGQPTTLNPTGPATGTDRVLRGGVWFNEATFARCAYRNLSAPNYAYYSIGFRCVRGH